MYEQLIKYYEEQYDENNRLTKNRASLIEFLTTVKYLDMLCPANSKILDACAGTGAYAFYLAEKGHSVTAGDLVAYNVSLIEQKQSDNPILEHIYTGNIMDMSMFSDNSFDVVLNLGSLYHMPYETDRAKAVKESLRVLKRGGIYFAAYINKYAQIIKYRNQLKEDFDTLEEFYYKGFNEADPLFCVTTPEEVEAFMSTFDLKSLHNVGTDGVGYLMKKVLETFNENEFYRWLDLHFATCEVKSLLGYSEHGLYIGMKK